jgi:hypothetical protein
MELGRGVLVDRRRFLRSALSVPALAATIKALGASVYAGAQRQRRSYQFDRSISREVLDAYLSRSISMEGVFNGRGDLEDNISMLTAIGAKYIGRSICLWGGESNLLSNFDRAATEVPLAHSRDKDMVLEACIFEIVTTQVEQIPVPA